MRQQIDLFFTNAGYHKLYSNKEEIVVYFENQIQFLSVIMLLDLEEGMALFSDTYRYVRQQIIRQFKEKGFEDVHLLTLLISRDAASAGEIIKDEPFAWVVDALARRLLVPEGHVEDFYGLKSSIEECIRHGGDDTALELEGNAKGDWLFILRNKAFVSYAVVILNFVIFTACIFGGDAFYEFGTMYPREVIGEGRWYQLVVSMFFHASAQHIFGNMLLLYLLGDIVELRLGHVRYLVLYLLAGIGGNLLSLLYSFLQADAVGSLGASGAIYGVVGAFLWILICNKGRIGNVLLPRALFMFGYSLYLGFTSTHVDNAAHVGGLFAGFLLAVVLYQKERRKVNEG